MIKFSKPFKIIAGAVIAAAIIIFTALNTYLFYDDGFKSFEYALMYILAAGCVIFMTFDFSNIYKPVYRAMCAAVFIAAPFIMTQLSMTISGNAEFSAGIYLMNVLIYFLPAAIIYLFTNSFPVSATVSVSLGALFNITCYVVNALRGNPFIPADILALKTAAAVASTYVFKLEWQLVYTAVLTAFSITIIWALPLKVRFKRSPVVMRGAAAMFLLVVFVSFSFVNFSKINMDVFDQYHANNTHGAAYSFFINSCKMRIEKPKDYSENNVKLMLNSLGDDTPMPKNKPNIVIIMNESYADLNVVGEVQTNIPYNDYFYSIKKNATRGELLVSPFGGYTCNTEFELLTGLTMGLLPSNATPYLQYINKKCPYYLPAYMKSLGYTTIALHPYFARSWNRETVYKLMGFDNFISMEKMGDYQDASQFELMRSYLSDNTSFSALINQFETKADDERLFLFNITMQNHGGYTFGGSSFTNDVKITNLSGHYPQAEQYLSLLKRTDSALRILIDYFKAYDEPTVVVMFGDHLPAVEQDFYEELYGKTLDNIDSEELRRRYRVPFFIWTNYDRETEEDIETSINYLSGYILEAAGIPKNKINLFLDSIQEEIPRINAIGHFDINGSWGKNDTEKSDALQKYNCLEYYMLTHKPSDTDEP